METTDAISPKSATPPPTQEPEPKRLKMSTTTTSDDEETANPTTESTRKRKYKRRKIAMFFAYCGVGYQGMQKNPGAKTIEGDLEEALFHAGAVPEQDRGRPRCYDWARSARTDKGVSAVGQVVSGRFYIDPPGLVERLNSCLPGQIRIFGYKRVTASFNAKKYCDRRRYVYLIPVFALDPSCHRDRESVLASVGSGNELAKCLECSERGRKVVGLMGKRSPEEKFGKSQSGILPSSGDGINVDAVKEGSLAALVDNESNHSNVAPECVAPIDANESNDSNVASESVVSMDKNDYNAASESVEVNDATGNGDSKVMKETNGFVQNEDSAVVPVVKDEKAGEEANPETGSQFFYGEKERERFNRILKYYVGSHNFHNFTTRTKAEDPSARRYIVSFHANTTVTVEGIEFVKCEVVGQSFMLHQIRKMMGLAVAIMRNCAPESLIQTALQKDININVPTAPEVGLYLDECLFTSYNQKWKDHEELSMKAYEKEAEEFKMGYIYSHIASTEHREGAVALWLHSLNHRNYPNLQDAGCKDAYKKTVQVEDNKEVGEGTDAEADANANPAEIQDAAEENMSE